MTSPGRIKRWVYRQGFRPSRRSPFYSPSLSTHYVFVPGRKKR